MCGTPQITPRVPQPQVATAPPRKAARVGLPGLNRLLTTNTDEQRLFLGKFIYHPVVLSSLDQDYLGKSARDVGRSSRRDQHDRETVAAGMSVATRDLEGAVGRVRKKLFQFVGVLRVADVIAEQDHAAFDISRLPRVQEMVGGGQGKHVAGV